MELLFDAVAAGARTHLGEGDDEERQGQCNAESGGSHRVKPDDLHPAQDVKHVGEGEDERDRRDRGLRRRRARDREPPDPRSKPPRREPVLGICGVLH